MNNDTLEKGKSYPIGTIHNGFKKVAEGKWRKVSEKGLTKEQHEKKSDEYYKSPSSMGSELGYEHSQHAKKLDSKEYSDTEVVGEEKVDDYVKTKKEIIKRLEDRIEELNNSTANMETEQQLKKVKGILSVHKSELTEYEKNNSIKKSISPDIQKALTTLEIGYLSGEVDEQTIISARMSAEDLEKGRKANIGEIRDWKGRKFRRTAEGWEPVKGDGKPKGTDQPNMSEKVQGKVFGEGEKKGDRIEHNGVTIHVGKDTSGGQNTTTYTAPSVSEKTFWDLDKLKEVIDSKGDEFQYREERAFGEVRNVDEISNKKPDYLLVRKDTGKIIAGYSSMNIPKGYIETYQGPNNKTPFKLISGFNSTNPAPYLDVKPVDPMNPKDWDNYKENKFPTKKAIYFRLEGDRKFFSESESEVIKYAKVKYNLSEAQVSELEKFGTTQDGKVGIKQFRSR